MIQIAKRFEKSFSQILPGAGSTIQEYFKRLYCSEDRLDCLGVAAELNFQRHRAPYGSLHERKGGLPVQAHSQP